MYSLMYVNLVSHALNRMKLKAFSLSSLEIGFQSSEKVIISPTSSSDGSCRGKYLLANPAKVKYTARHEAFFSLDMGMDSR